jgi:UDP-N-acetyl-D-mannosaminuronic acid dehydrogenase
MTKVLVVGLGQLGLPVAQYVKQRGFDTYGYDMNTRAIKNAESNACIKRASNFSNFDVYILCVCVSTHEQDDKYFPDVNGPMSIAQRIAEQAPNGALI